VQIWFFACYVGRAGVGVPLLALGLPGAQRSARPRPALAEAVR
jgi:hypothetical protein